MYTSSLSQCPLENIKQRAFLLATIRNFFFQREVLEVETPILSSAGNTDIHIESFNSQAIDQTLEQSFLRTSAEFPLKRLLCSGVGDIYELGKVFRRSETSKTHNLEFTLLEWYRIEYSYSDLIQEVIELIECILLLFGLKKIKNKTLTYSQVFERYLNLDINNTSIDDLNLLCRKFNYSGSFLTQDEGLDFLFATQVQHKFNKDTLTFVTLYPATQAALAQINPEDNTTSLRFELFYKGYELGNGYQELTNAHELKERFEKDNQIRVNNHQSQLPIDQNLLQAMQLGMPNCSGIAIGIDRLLMSLLDCHHISEVLTFNAGNA